MIDLLWRHFIAFLTTWSSLIGFVGVLVSTFALVIALRIAKGQTIQGNRVESLTKQVNEDVLGTLSDFEDVLRKIVALLEEAEKERRSEVYIMAYWYWFGADLKFVQSGLSDIDHLSSEVATLLRSRIVKNLKTTIVLLEHETDIEAFLKDLVQHYKIISAQDKDSRSFDPTEEDVKQLVTRYMLDLQSQLQTAKKYSNITIKQRAEIPALIFAVNGAVSAGVWYVGERAMIKAGAELGGFSSRSPAMVGILVNHVSHFTRD